MQDKAILNESGPDTPIPIGQPNCSLSLNDLTVLNNYDQLGSVVNLDEEITFKREALSLCPIGHPDRPMFLDNLATAVCTRYEQSGNLEDLEEAITYHREAYILRPIGHPDHVMSFNNLARVVLARRSRIVELNVAAPTFVPSGLAYPSPPSSPVRKMISHICSYVVLTIS